MLTTDNRPYATTKLLGYHTSGQWQHTDHPRPFYEGTPMAMFPLYLFPHLLRSHYLTLLLQTLDMDLTDTE